MPTIGENGRVTVTVTYMPAGAPEQGVPSQEAVAVAPGQAQKGAEATTVAPAPSDPREAEAAVAMPAWLVGAAVLKPNARAITVGVDAVTGTAGLIWPGDRVDLLLTQTLDDRVAVLSRRVVGETVLNDVRVIAVDQQLTQGAAGANASPDGRVARTVTLEVTPEEAERVAVAAQLGRLSLTIRSMAVEATDLPLSRRSVFGGDASPALAQTDPVERPIGARIRIIQGDERQEVVFP